MMSLTEQHMTKYYPESEGKSTGKGRLLFAHDRIRDAFYYQIGEEKRQKLYKSNMLLCYNTI